MDDPMSFEVRIDGRLVLGSMPTFSFSGLVDNAGASFTTHMLQFALLPDALCRERQSCADLPCASSNPRNTYARALSRFACIWKCARESERRHWSCVETASRVAVEAP
jgi:hypothetical protein